LSPVLTESGDVMIPYRKQIIFVVVSIVICVALIVSIFFQARRGALREMNERQKIYAALAAKGIGSVLDQNLAVLQALSQSNRVIRMEEDGKTVLQAALQGSGKYVQGITRVNRHGKIVYTFPTVPGAVGTDISGQPHIREALQTKKPVVSDIFDALQGFRTMAVHVPVFRGKTFDGTVGFLINFSDLAKEYLNNLYIPGSRYALLVNSRGKIIHCINPAHSGRPALAYFQNDFEAAVMVRDMISGKEGETTVADAHFSDGPIKSRRAHAVHAPLRVGNGYWSVAVVSTEHLMLPWAKNIRTQLLVLALMLIVFLVLTVYTIARLRSAAVERQQRKKIEDDLLDSAREISDLYHNAPCGYLSLDANAAIVRINDRLLAWLGYTREELLGHSSDGILAPGSRPIFAETFARLKEEGLARDIEYEMMRKDQTFFPVLVNATAVTDADGRFVMSRTMVLDVTQRRAQEERLRESEELYRTALESTSDGVTILQDGKYVYVSRKFLDTMGVERDAILDRPLGVLAGPDAQAGLKAFLERHPQSVPAPDINVTRVLKTDGSVTYLQSSSVDIVYQRKPAILTFIKDITKQREAEQALRESEELYRTALEKSNDGITIIQNGAYVYANHRLLRTIGREEAGILGLPLGIYTHPDDRDMVKRYYEARKRGEWAPSSYDMRVLKPDGSVISININAVAITYRGAPATLSFVLDITERKRAEDALRQSEERYRTIIENIGDGYYEVAPNGNILFANDACCRVTGRTREKIIGIGFREVFFKEDIGDIIRIYKHTFMTGEPQKGLVKRLKRPDGREQYVEFSVSLKKDGDGKPSGFMGIIHDVTERRKYEEMIQRMAYHDALTGLPNRLLFRDRLVMAIAQAKRNGEHMAVMMLDLDKFKEINDTRGHDVGDSVLCSFTERINKRLRAGDTFARTGGDEFMIIMPRIRRREDLSMLGKTLVGALEAPVTLGLATLKFSVSIGIAIYPRDGLDFDALVKNADTAMYLAKERGGNTYEIYAAPADEKNA